MKPFTKIIHPADTNQVAMFCKIQLQEGGKLSISGVIGPMSNGNAIGSCGQIIMDFKEYDQRGYTTVDALTPAAGWNRDTLRKFFDIWDRWHLNDLKAGTPKQEQYLREHPVNHIDHYANACKVLTEAGLNPDDGYSYGSKWLREEIPADVLNFLSSLPDTDRNPAWV